MTALALILELGDIERFKDLDHLSSYMGLIPNVSSSDDKEYVGRQTNRGRKLLRRLWIQSSWRARSLDPALLQAYEEYCLRMKAQRAIIKIAKKLLSKTRHVWLKGEVYQMGIK